MIVFSVSNSIHLQATSDIVVKDIDFKLTHEKLKLGDVLKFVLTGYNPTNITHTVAVDMSVAVSVGNRSNFIYNTSSEMFAGENSDAKCSFHILPQYYATQLAVDKTMMVEVIARVANTGQKFKHYEDVSFAEPSINLTCSQTIVMMGDPVKLHLVIRNPRAVRLTNSYILLESEEHLTFPFTQSFGTIKHKKKVVATAIIGTKSVGEFNFVVTFNSEEVKGLRDECRLQVVDSS